MDVRGTASSGARHSTSYGVWSHFSSLQQLVAAVFVVSVKKKYAGPDAEGGFVLHTKLRVLASMLSDARRFAIMFMFFRANVIISS